MMKAKKPFQQLDSKNVCQVYEFLQASNSIPFSISPEGLNKIDSLVHNINGMNFGVENYSNSKEKAVAYMYFIIKDHPFIDGNKRTSVLTFLTVARLNNLKIKETYRAIIDELAVFIEKTTGDHQKIIQTIAEEVFE